MIVVFWPTEFSVKTVLVVLTNRTCLSPSFFPRTSTRSWGTIDNSDSVTHTYQGFEGYTVLDVRAHYQVGDNWSAALGIDNLNNDKYFIFHPFPQRTLVMEIHYAQ